MGEQQTAPDTLDQATVAQRAYARWEAEGRPEGRAEAHWHAAEEEIRHEQESSGAPAARDTDAPANDAAADLRSGPAVTNADRALPPNERRRVRAARNKARSPTPPPEATEPPPHFVVTLDRAHLRIYRVNETNGPSGMQLQLEQSVDLPAGKADYTDRDTDQAGRFPGRGVAAGGGHVDERLPMQEEHDRRLADELAKRLESFLRQQTEATWDFAAGPALHHVVLDRLSAATRARLGTAIPKDLVNQPVETLRDHFRNPAAPRPRPAARTSRG